MTIYVKAQRLLKTIARRRTLARELRAVDVVVVSIKKSGRTWVRAMLTRLFHNVYGTPTNLLLDAANHKSLNPAAPSVLFAHDSDPVALADHVAADLSVYDGVNVVLLVRNPADIIVSLYHHYSTRKTGKRQKLAAESTIYEFSTRANHGIHTIISFLNNWACYAKKNQNILVVKYEDLSADPEGELRKLASRVGASATPEDLNDAVTFASIDNLRKLETEGFFEHVSLRKTDTGNPEGLKVRRGRVAGYKDYFTPDECHQIERIIENDLDPWFGYRFGQSDAGSDSPGASD